ncbi:MAG: hypothetical protein OXI94_03845 [Gemmatimonadota bacterium]|nr:hypothetical protein [Gemmatimonadota bacterium]
MSRKVDRDMDKRLSDNPTEIVSANKTSDDRAAGLVQLVQSWMDEGDADEQRETLEYLIQALDEDRLSSRKLFPKELQGKSW